MRILLFSVKHIIETTTADNFAEVFIYKKENESHKKLAMREYLFLKWEASNTFVRGFGRQQVNKEIRFYFCILCLLIKMTNYVTLGQALHTIKGYN